MPLVMCRIILSVTFLLCLGGLTSAEPPAETPATAPTTAPAAVPATEPAGMSTTAPSVSPTTHSAEVASLIGQLSSDEWRERQKAEDRLVDLGEEAVPALRQAAAEATTTEQRTRAAVALGRIDQIAANGPTRITLHLKDVNPKEVVAELARQAGAPIKVWPEQIWDRQPSPRVTIDADKEPFWLAIADFCEKANVRPQAMGFGREITLMQGGSFGLNGPRCLTGQFLVTATGAQRDRSIRFGINGANPARQSSDLLSLQVYVDPRARVLAYVADADVIEAVDDKGKSLGTHKAGGMASGPMNQRPFTFGLSVALSYPDDGYTKLSRLKGSFAVVVATKTETLDIPDMEKAISAPRTLAGRTVELKDVKLQDHSFSYRLHVHRAGLPVEQWQNMFNDLQGVRITDATGNTVAGGGGGSFGDSDAEVSSSYNTGATLKGPMRLVWEMTTETKQRSVPFEFKDLPLPTP